MSTQRSIVHFSFALLSALPLVACGTADPTNLESAPVSTQNQELFIPTRGDPVFVDVRLIETERAYTFVRLQIGTQHFELDIHRQLDVTHISVYDPDGNVVRAFDQNGWVTNDQASHDALVASAYVMDESFLGWLMNRRPQVRPEVGTFGRQPELRNEPPARPTIP